MAVYQGARQPGGIAFPWLRPSRETGREPEPSHRRRDAAGTRAHGTRHTSARSIGRRRQRTRTVGIVLAAIVIAFSGAFLSLSQSVRVAATSYDITRLVSERDRLTALQLDLRSNVERLRSEPAIRKEGLDGGLGQLGAPVVLPAR